MPVLSFADFLTDSGVDINSLSNEEKYNWRQLYLQEKQIEKGELLSIVALLLMFQLPFPFFSVPSATASVVTRRSSPG